MPAKFNETKKTVLVAFYQFIRENDGQIWLASQDVEPYTDGTLSRSFIQLALQTLQSEGHLTGNDHQTGKSETFCLTSKGITQAEKYAEELGLWSDFDQLRTSVNEIIDLDQEKTADARQALSDLSAALEKGNDVGNLSEAEVQSAIVEVNSLRQMLDGAKIRAGVMATQARQSLKWITEQASKTIVGELSKKALILILTLLGYGT